jgi:cytochrome c553
MRPGSGRQRIIALAVAALPWAGASRADPLSDQVQLCTACHDHNGVARDTMTPMISGQQEGYLYLQLRDYKNGDRKSDVMAPIAEALERTDMLALAEYFSRQPWPDLRQPAASEAVTTQALRANGSVGCTGCHLGDYQGTGTQPRLSGQARDYLLQTMRDFRSRRRGNNPGMSDLMIATAESDLVALADYLAGR